MKQTTDTVHSQLWSILWPHIITGVRANLKAWIKKLECDGDLEKQALFKKKFIQRLKESPVAIETEKANEQHYEVPTEFFLTVLNPLISVLY